MKDEVNTQFRILYEEFCSSYRSPSIVRIMKLRSHWAGHAAWMGEVNAYRILVAKSL
jgi:hypothetical protein